MVQDEPSPLDLSARQKLQADWITESNNPGLPLPSCSPQIVAITSTGTRSKLAARWAAESMTPCMGWLVPLCSLARSMMPFPPAVRYRSASCFLIDRSRITNHLRLEMPAPVGACSANSIQRKSSSSGTSRSRSRRRRTARVVLRSSSVCSTSKDISNLAVYSACLFYWKLAARSISAWQALCFH